MPCGTLRASLPQFLHSAPVDDQCPPHTRDWVLTKPGVRCLPYTLFCRPRAGMVQQHLQLRSAVLMGFCKRCQHVQSCRADFASCVDLTGGVAVVAAERDASARSRVSAVARLGRWRHARRHACRPVLCTQLLTREVSWFLLSGFLHFRITRSVAYTCGRQSLYSWACGRSTCSVARIEARRLPNVGARTVRYQSLGKMSRPLY